MLITFSGLDGAGKSTLIAQLEVLLGRNKRRVSVFHMNDHIGVYAYLRYVRDWLFGPRAVSSSQADVAGPAADGSPTSLVRRLRNAILWNSALRRWVYPIDLIIFLCYRFYVEALTRRVLIMDRYFYDTLVDVAAGGGWVWVRLLALLTPTPTLPIYLDITAEESYARKGEYSIEYLRGRQACYERVFIGVKDAVKLPTTRDLPTTVSTLESLVLERLVRG